MPKYRVEVVRVLTSRKVFEFEGNRGGQAPEEVALEIAQSCDETVSRFSGWEETAVWDAHCSPRVGDIVKFASPNPGEEHFRFKLLELKGREALVELQGPFRTKPTEWYRADIFCLAETED